MSEQVNVTSKAQEDILVKHQGPQGEPGNTGMTGMTGNTGPQGPAHGATGATGSDGAAGNQGNTGNTGKTGMTGKTGNTGMTGNTGAAGANGQDGAAGATWTAGTTTPSNASGSDGDFFFDTDDHKVFWKSQGTWTELADVSGNVGPTGPQGPAGGAVTSLNNATENELVTIGSTTTELDAEANLTFDGTDLKVEGDIHVAGNVKHKDDTDTYIEFTGDKIRFIAGGKPLIHAEEASIDTVIINDGGNDCDFRVESQNDENMIFVDGDIDKVGIAKGAPDETLHVGGSVKIDTIATDSSNTSFLVEDNGVIKKRGGGGGLNNVAEDTTPQLGGDLDIDGNKIVSTSNGNIELEPNGTGKILLDGNVSLGGHVLPTVHATGNSPYPGFDLGSADYKIRHLFLSSNSLWVGDEHKVEVSGGKMKFKKRKKSVIPKAITDSGGNEAGALAHSGKGSLAAMTLAEHVSYLTSLDSNKVDVSDLYPPEEVNGSANAAYTDNDWGEISSQEQSGKHVAPLESGIGQIDIELAKGKTFIVDDPIDDLTVNAVGAQATEGVATEFVLYVNQGAVAATISSLMIDQQPVAQLRISGEDPSLASMGDMNTFDIKALYVGGSWKATVVVG